MIDEIMYQLDLIKIELNEIRESNAFEVFFNYLININKYLLHSIISF